ncbi:MAG TPA: mechanosensitive ion channel domain-containing protein [Thermoanaerobaculia bacterium]|nr:mechanosensitive ion channel domain-containing protein [Thermoanaerobaculia bacterium]
MVNALALAAGIAVFAVLVALIAWAGRRSFFVRQLAFPLHVAAAACSLGAVRLLQPLGLGTPELHKSLVLVLDGTLIFLGIVLVLRLLGLYLFDVHLTARRGMRLPPLLPAVTMAVAYLITALITLRLTFPQFDIRPLLATSAVTSLVLGLALQPLLGNFFAGLVISIEKPFRINDWIRVGDLEGRVVAITWRTTHLRTRENDNLVIPNGKLADERVLNYYYPHPMHMERVQVGADYKVPPYRVRRALLDCVSGVPGALDKPTPDVFILRFDENAIVYELRVWVEDMVQAPRIASDLRGRIWEEFQRAGIIIPTPIRTLHLAPRPRRERGAPEDGPWPARLYIAEGPDRGRSVALAAPPAPPAVVGRSRVCTLVLSDPNASKEHLRIAWEDGAWVLTDLGSSFGTQVNGEPADRVALRPLDRVTVGDTVMIVEKSDAP